MKLFKRICIFIFFIIVLGIPSCGSTQFKYEWFGIAPDEDGFMAGHLLGAKESDDRDLVESCYPLPNEKGRCVVILRSEFERLVTDFVKYKSVAESCESLAALPQQ